MLRFDTFLVTSCQSCHFHILPCCFLLDWLLLSCWCFFCKEEQSIQLRRNCCGNERIHCPKSRCSAESPLFCLSAAASLIILILYQDVLSVEINYCNLIAARPEDLQLHIAHWYVGLCWNFLNFHVRPSPIARTFFMRLRVCVCVCVFMCSMNQYEALRHPISAASWASFMTVRVHLPSLALFLPMFEGDTSFAKLWRNRHTCLEECSQMSRDGSVCRPCADAIPTCARFETAEDSWVIRDATNLGSIWRCWWCHQRLWR